MKKKFLIGFSAFDGCNNITIYCESESEPSAWSSSWAGDSSPFVTWGVEYTY